MAHALKNTRPGHLCLGTLHANSANQTIERIISFFSEERRNADSTNELRLPSRGDHEPVGKVAAHVLH